MARRLLLGLNVRFLLPIQRISLLCQPLILVLSVDKLEDLRETQTLRGRSRLLSTPNIILQGTSEYTSERSATLTTLLPIYSKTAGRALFGLSHGSLEP